MGNPYKNTGAPKTAPGSEAETPRPAPGKAITNSRMTGDPLPNGEKDVPAYSPPIAWPAADNGPKKPYKTK